jgi:hypothetical protein
MAQFTVSQEMNALIQSGAPEVVNALNQMPHLEPWHIKSVSVPLMPAGEIKAEYDGTIPYPHVLEEDFRYTFSLDFEEDAHGTVLNWIMKAMKKITPTGGITMPRSVQVIGDFSVVILNDQYNTLTEVIYRNVILKSASDLAFDYTNETGIRTYQCSFFADSRIINTMPVRLVDLYEAPTTHDSTESKS